MTDKTREDFEAWARSKGAPKEGWWIRQIDDGGYSCGPVDDAWNGYQAATKHSAARIAELEAQANVCGSGAGCLYKDARIEALEAEVQALRKDVEHKDAFAEQIGRDLSKADAECRALRRDAARLDYIQKNARSDPKMDGKHVWWPTTFNHAQNLKGTTIRAAIDAAIEAERAKP